MNDVQPSSSRRFSLIELLGKKRPVLSDDRLGSAEYRLGANSRRFSLIELLVVIGIIAILASMLLPALVSAKKQAHYARWTGYSKNMKADASLMAYYDFERHDAIDTVRNEAFGIQDPYYKQRNLDGILYGGAARVRGRYPGKGAVLFYGGGSTRMQVPDSGGGMFDDYLTPPESFTMFMSFKPTALSGRLMHKRTGGNANTMRGYDWLIGGGAAKPWCGRVGGGNAGAVPASTPLAVGEWTHLVVTFDESAGVIKSFTNGELSNSSSWVGPLWASTELLRIGNSSGNNAAYKGIIDEVGIFSRAFTDQEVKDMYSMGVAHE